MLAFPREDVLRLAVSSGLIPRGIAQSPCRAWHDADGKITIQFEGSIPAESSSELAALGVARQVDQPTGEARSCDCWFQLFPLASVDSHLSGSGIILFRLGNPSDVATVMMEMLRLGVDRQEFAIIDGTALIRVVNPPVYTLLRAVDSKLATGGMQAFTEAKPNVWLQIQHSHPLIDMIDPPRDGMLLISWPNDWQRKPVPSFRDLYDLSSIEHESESPLAARTEEWPRFQVPISLIPGNDTLPQLWVIENQAAAFVQKFVEESDSRLLDRLEFAAGGDDATGATILLRSRDAALLPQIASSAAAFAPYWHLPNLFLPAGLRLHPPLRRDIVAQLLAPDADRVYWLRQEADRVRPFSISTAGFRPLAEWVDYVSELEQQSLEAWMKSTLFDFADFIVIQEGKAERQADRVQTRVVAREEVEEKKPESPPLVPVRREPLPKLSHDSETDDLAELKNQCSTLEEAFLEAGGSLESPERVELWHQLAEAYAALGGDRIREAVLCELNWHWARRSRPGRLIGDSEPWTPQRIESILANPLPGTTELRELASAIFESTRTNAPAWFADMRPAIQSFLETHQELLPVKALWLTATALSEHAGGDVLALARCRDSLLARMLDRGMSPNLDLPGFLRFSDSKHSSDLRHALDGIRKAHQASSEWTLASLTAGQQAPTRHQPRLTLAYADLMFAWGNAMLGESSAANALAAAALETLLDPSQSEEARLIGSFLSRSFRFRIDQASNGIAHPGPLPDELLSELEEFRRLKQGVPNSPHGTAEYCIARMREQSAILDPLEKLDPYAESRRNFDDLTRVLADLPWIREPNAFRRAVRDVYRGGVRSRLLPETRLLLLHQALPLAPRAGRDFLIELLDHVPQVLNDLLATTGLGADSPRLQVGLCTRALHLAVFLEHPERVDALVNLLLDIILRWPLEQRYELIAMAGQTCLTHLRRPEWWGQVERIANRLESEALAGRSAEEAAGAHAGNPAIRADCLRAYLAVAAARWMLNQNQDDAAIPDRVRQELMAPATDLPPRAAADLAQHYLQALDSAAPDVATARIVDFFRHMPHDRIRNTFGTAPYYSRFHLNIVEAAVMALAGNESRAGRQSRRWLDEEELIARRRIDSDMAAVLPS